MPVRDKMNNSAPRNSIATRNFAATETTDFAGGRTVAAHRPEAAVGVQVRLLQAVP